MRIVTVATGHTRREHLALLERQVVVELFDVAHLTVGVGQIAVHRRRQMCVRQRLPGDPFFRELRAPCVTQTARFHFLARTQRHAVALWHPCLVVLRPGCAGSLVELHDKPLRSVLLLAPGPPAFSILCPCDVTGAGTMTRLTADADL